MKRRSFVCCLALAIFLFGSPASCGSASISDLTDETYLSRFEEITEEEALLIISTYDYQTAYDDITRIKCEYYELDTDSTYGEIKSNIAIDMSESSLYLYFEPTSTSGTNSYYILINGSNDSYTMSRKPINSPTVSTTSLTYSEARYYVEDYYASYIVKTSATSLTSNSGVVSYSKYSNLLRIDIWSTATISSTYGFYVFDSIGRLRHIQTDRQYSSSSRTIRNYMSTEYNTDLGTRLTSLF